jgi:hypothetical protein
MGRLRATRLSTRRVGIAEPDLAAYLANLNPTR